VRIAVSIFSETSLISMKLEGFHIREDGMVFFAYYSASQPGVPGAWGYRGINTYKF
jgi:hypothetical protein